MANESALLEQAPEVEEAPSLRETLEQAFDKAEEPAQAEVPAPAPPASEPAPPQEATPKPASPAQASETAEKPTQAPTAPIAPTELKAPAQWKPAVREKWNALPREVQEEVIRREGDAMRLIGSVGPKIRMADEVVNHLAPFAEKLQEAGVTPSAFISDVFTSIKSLTSGNPQEKAEIVANIVQSYGVDLRALDAILSQRVGQPPEVLQARQVLARQQYMQQDQQQSLQHQSALEAEKALAAFGADPAHEFLDQVRDLMADLIEAGRATTLDDAYAAAIWAHADTRKILLQREAEQRAAVKGKRAAAARLASSSVSGSPTSGSAARPNPQAMSLRESLEAAFDEHTPL